MTSVTKRLWWQAGVFCSLYRRSLKDSNGDSTGNLGGIIEKP
jgi:hypothetical protein